MMLLLALRLLAFHVAQYIPLLLCEVLCGGGDISLATAEAGIIFDIVTSRAQLTRSRMYRYPESGVLQLSWMSQLLVMHP